MHGRRNAAGRVFNRAEQGAGVADMNPGDSPYESQVVGEGEGFTRQIGLSTAKIRSLPPLAALS